jgi:Mor family transcriptional regulator
MTLPAELERLVAAAGRREVDHAWPESLLTVADVFAAHFRRRGDPEDRATEQARVLALELAWFLGGHCLYLPTVNRIEQCLERKEIFAAFRAGEKPRDIARRFRRPERAVYKIVKEEEDRETLMMATAEGNLT